MVTGEDSWPVAAPTGPQHPAEVPLFEIDQGDPSALARLTDVLYRWRFGLVVLSPLVVGIVVIGVASQGWKATETTVEADIPGSALEPVVVEVTGPSSRSGAAPADQPATSSTIVIQPAEPTSHDGCALEIEATEPDLQAGPTTSSEVIMTVPAGSYPAIQTVDSNGTHWHFISVDGVFGWIPVIGPDALICS